MQRKGLSVLLAVCAAVLSQISLTTYSQNAPEEPTQVVVVPKRDLAKGATPTQSDLEEKKVALRLAPINAVSGIPQVLGRTLKKAKNKGSIILIDDLSNAGDPDNKPD
ncbi:MAG TPA: SAF domain-containing protein [Candidatus Obscuribacterales bacterium]